MVEIKVGRYTIIDGISGSSKETQGGLLSSWLIKKGYDVLEIHEPYDARVKKSLKEIKNAGIDNPYADAAIFTFDRLALSYEKIFPAIREGKTVISLRGFTSTLAVQSGETFSMEFLRTVNSFVPQPDLIYILDVPAEVGFARVQNRSVGTWEGERGIWETKLKEMERMRRNFLQLQNYLTNVEIVDANRTKEQVHEHMRKVWVRKFES